MPTEKQCSLERHKMFKFWKGSSRDAVLIDLISVIGLFWSLTTSLPSVESRRTIYSYFKRQPLRAGPYAFLCKLRKFRTKSLASGKRYLSRDLTRVTKWPVFHQPGRYFTVNLAEANILINQCSKPVF